MTFRILLADDEPLIKTLVSRVFHQELAEGSYQVSFAEDGRAALRLLERESFDILLTDINMPEMDGLTLLAETRRRYPQLVSVVLSAYGDLANIRKAMNSGAFDFLVKPFDIHDFRTTLDKCTEQARRLREWQEAKETTQRAQKELVDHLRRADRLKDEFLADVSHELLTPLNGIVGMAESLADGAGGKLSAKVGADLAMITASGKRLTSLVHDILDFAQMKNDNLHLDLKDVDVRPLVEVVLTLSRPLLAGKDVLLQAQLPDDLPPVFADENRLQQILHNLVNNAAKFTTRGSISVTAMRARNAVRLTVTDTGIGIPDQQQQDIFEAFARLQDDEGPIPAGTGLGLTITRKLIQLMGGEVTMQSQPGKGSSFSVSLPVAEAFRESGPPTGEHTVISFEATPQDDPEPIPTVAVGERAARILAVDDEPVNLAMLKNQLALCGYRVDVAADGPAALQAVEDCPHYDLVLLDVTMPGMNGYEVCRKLRETYSLLELPILILSAKTHPRSYVEGLEAGANDYLPKPFDKRELLARTHTLLTLKQTMRRAIRHHRVLEAERLKRVMADHLRRTTEQLTSTLELGQVLSRFLECLMPVATYRRAVVALRNGDDLEPVALHGFGDPPRTEALQVLLNRLEEVLACTREPLLLDNPARQAPPETLAFFGPGASLLAVPILGQGTQGGIVMLQREGAPTFSEEECRLVAAFAAQAAVAIENARLFEKVQTMAKTEELTGLHNRRHFFVLGREAFDDAASADQPLGAIMLDVDHFKNFNDRHGHHVGDEVLQCVAERLRIACRKTDIIGRYGGEEFAVLLPHTSLEVTYEVAERLRREISEPFQPQDHPEPIVVTVSLGVAARDDGTRTLADLLRHADKALYCAKEAGRNRALAYPHLEDHDADRRKA